MILGFWSCYKDVCVLCNDLMIFFFEMWKFVWVLKFVVFLVILEVYFFVNFWSVEIFGVEVFEVLGVKNLIGYKLNCFGDIVI